MKWFLCHAVAVTRVNKVQPGFIALISTEEKNHLLCSIKKPSQNEIMLTALLQVEFGKV